MADRTDRTLTGLGIRLFAILCISSMAALIKVAETRGATLVEVLFFRQLCALPPVMAWLAIGPGLGTIRTKRFGAHATRTSIGLISMVFNFGGIMLLPLAESTTLQFTVPIFATILSAVLLREGVGWHRWAAVLAGFMGVLIVAQPSGGHFPLLGTGVALTASLLMATVAIQLRQMGKTESAGTTVFWFSLLSLPPLAIAYAFYCQHHDGWTWFVLIVIGLIGGVAQIALTGALRLAPVSVVLPMDYSSLVWATLYGWLLFGVLPTPYTWVGAPIIIASGLYIVWREHRKGQPESPVSAADTPA